MLFISMQITPVFCAEPVAAEQYKINAGDQLSVHVWNEENVSQKEILVRPDGRISMPIVGEVLVSGKSIDTVKLEIAQRLSTILIDKPVVTVSVTQLSGNTVFVLGKVARPGQYIILGKFDVTQALALAGGTTTFAKENDIKILRRNADGVQTAIAFNYGKIEGGKNLESNIFIQSGDVVIVP
jgi:polysaccharide export outer membrane protein